jgi:hypothetical protein
VGGGRPRGPGCADDGVVVEVVGNSFNFYDFPAQECVPCDA